MGNRLSGILLTHRMIEAFRAAILHGGISAAATALGMSQPHMSRLLADLQRAAGFQLFVKHGRTVKPTEEALALMTKVQQSFLGLEDIAQFTEQIRKQRQGRLAICAIPALGHSVLPGGVEYLRGLYPTVTVALHIASSTEVSRRVIGRQADLGFAAEGMAIGGAEAILKLTSQCLCIAPPGAWPKSVKQIRIEDLMGRRFIELTGTIQRQFDALLTVLGGSVEVVSEVSQSLSASELVMRGLGVALVDPFTGAMHRARGGLALPVVPSIHYTVEAIAMGDARMSDPAKALVEYVRQAAG